MYRFLLHRRWVAFHLVVVVLVTAFVNLGMWQLRRLHQRRAANAVITGNAHRAPVPVDSVMGRGRPVLKAEEWQPVTATGHYQVADQVLARQRTLDGDVGFEVVTPLVTPGGTVLLVDRGWVGATGNAQSTPPVAAPPAGQVTVTGRVRRSEPAGYPGPRGTAGVPAGQVNRIDTAALGARIGAPVYGGYVELMSEQPSAPTGAGAPTLLPGPTVDDGPHLAYAVQWFLFCLVAVGGWVLYVRREAAERRSQQAGGPSRAPAATAAAPTRT